MSAKNCLFLSLLLCFFLMGCIPAFTPNPISVNDNGQIALALRKDGGYSLFDEGTDSLAVYITDREGDFLKRITPDDTYNISPQWSPNGDRLLYVEVRKGENWQIYTCDRDGKDRKKLAEEDKQIWCPQWSPDDKRVVYFVAKEDPFAFSLNIVDSETQEKKILLERAIPLFHCAMDDKDIFAIGVMGTETFGGLDLGEMVGIDMQDGKHKPLVKGVFSILSSLDMAAGGKKIIFLASDSPVSSEAEGYLQIYAFDRESGKIERLTASRQNLFFPAVSPHGDMIAFQDVAGEINLGDIHIMDTSGKEDRRLTTEGRFSYPFWVSEGTIGFVETVEPAVYNAQMEKTKEAVNVIWLMDVDGKDKINLSERIKARLHEE